MKNKLIYPIGIVVLLNLIVSGVIFFRGDAPEAIIGGTTNLDSLELSEDLTVGDDVTITGDITTTGNVFTDGGLIDAGQYDFGNAVSSSVTAAMICDNNLISIEPDSGDDLGASLSFPDDEALDADCLGDAGDMVTFVIDNATTSGSAYLDLTLTSIDYDYVSKSSDFGFNDMIVVRILNYDGASMSWTIDAVELAE